MKDKPRTLWILHGNSKSMSFKVSLIKNISVWAPHFMKIPNATSSAHTLKEKTKLNNKLAKKSTEELIAVKISFLFKSKKKTMIFLEYFARIILH